jgi:hypothetical protein
MNSKGFPLECPDADADLQELINALTTYDYNTRAGYRDVLRWLNNSGTFTWGFRPAEEIKQDIEIEFDGVMCRTAAELIKEMNSKWETAIRYLYRDTFKNYFAAKNPTLSQQADDIANDETTAGNHDFGLAKFIQYVSKAGRMDICPYYWCGMSYGKMSDIANAAVNDENLAGNITEMLRCGFISWKILNTQKDINEAALSAVCEIEEITANFPKLGCYAFIYRFSPFDENNMAPDRLFSDMTRSAGEWYEKSKELIADDKELGRLYASGYKKNDIYALKNTSGVFVSEAGDSDLTCVYLFFESACDDKTAVRDHYLKYGPQSYLYWWRQNIDLYTFNNATANEIKKRIRGVKIDSAMTIPEINQAFASLRQSLIDFELQFQGNYLLGIFGIPESKDIKGITTDNTYGFFVEDFYGIRVPVGYHRSVYDNK